MAGTKISDLPSASTLTGAELVPVVQSDVTKKTTITDILTSSGAGTVHSVDVSGGTTGLTTSGGPITTSGTITLGGTLDVDNGGTGATTAANARTNLDVPSRSGSGASGTWSIDVTGNAGTVTNGVYTNGSYSNPSWITALAGSKVTGDISGNAGNVSGTVAVANGGTGATTASSARTNLGLVIGTDVPSPTGTGASGTWSISINGNAATVTNGVYTSGSYANPTWLTSLAASKLTGQVAVTNGGTGQSSYTDGQLLIGNSTGNTLTKSTLTAGSGISITNGAGSITIAASGAGTGDVTGPASATDNAVARFDGTTGKLIKDTSDFTIDASNRVGIGGVATNTKVNITGVLPEVSGYCYSFANRGTVPSTTSNLPVGVFSELNTQASGTTWTLGTYYHFAAANGTAGANAVLNAQVGFHSPDLTIGQSAIGYNSSVNIGANKWNIYAGGDAQNFFRGKVGIGVGNTTPGSELDVKGTIRLSGSTSGYVGLAPAAAAGSTTYTLPSADGTNGQVLKTDGTGTLSWTSVGGTGTVTSVDVSGGTTGLTTSGGPITGAGTITLAGTLGIANGGTGQVTQQAAINALAGAQTSGYYLRGNGTNVSMSAIQAGDVPTLNQNTTGSAGSVANALTINNSGTGSASGATFNGSSAITISYNTVGASPLAGSSSLTTVGTIGSGTWQGSTIGVGYGGTGQTSYTDGQLLIGNSTGNTLTKSTLTAGTGISITNGSGSITIAATGGGGSAAGAQAYAWFIS